MDRLSFTIYQPNNKKTWWTPDTIVFTLWLTIFGILWLFDGKQNTYSTTRTFLAVLGCVVTMYYLISSIWKYKPLNGVLDGTLIFDNNGFRVNDTTYQLSEINNIDFWFSDYYGEISSSGRSFNPKRLQGVGNYITFTDAENEENQIFFKLEGKHSYLSLSPFINAAVKAHKMQFKQAVDLLGIENVSI
ncbi:MAG: hypothetical protein V4592_20625 [Bacteroidota bacterium]